MCSPKEKKYAHFIGQASWAGARIIQGQWTPQAQKLYDLLILIFSDNGKIADIAALKSKSGVSDQEWQQVVDYTTQVWMPIMDCGDLLHQFIRCSAISLITRALVSRRSCLAARRVPLRR